jgi:hypothetical protein
MMARCDFCDGQKLDAIAQEICRADIDPDAVVFMVVCDECLRDTSDPNSPASQRLAQKVLSGK